MLIEYSLINIFNQQIMNNSFELHRGDFKTP